MGQTAGFVALSVLWTFGELHPVGLAVGGTLERELAADSPEERRDQRPLVAGVVGVDARFELRSMRTPWLLVSGVGGVAGAEVANGWTPVWEAVVETGLAVSPEEAGMHVGGRIVKDLTSCFLDCTGGTSLLLRASFGTEVVGGLAGMHATKPTAAAGAELRLTPLQHDL